MLAVTTKNLSFIAFWLQFALSVVSAGILLFSVAFVPRVGDKCGWGALRYDCVCVCVSVCKIFVLYCLRAVFVRKLVQGDMPSLRLLSFCVLSLSYGGAQNPHRFASLMHESDPLT